MATKCLAENHCLCCRRTRAREAFNELLDAWDRDDWAAAEDLVDTLLTVGINVRREYSFDHPPPYRRTANERRTTRVR
jgi:hypothetical protein